MERPTGSLERATSEKKVTRLLIGDYRYDVNIVPIVLILGRCDPPDPQSSEPSYLCVRDEGGNVLHCFKDFVCLWGCPRSDAPEGCCHRTHVRIEIRESVVRLHKAGKYPLYKCTGTSYREVDQLELRAGEKVLISLAGLRQLEGRGDRCTEEKPPCIEVSVI